MITREPLTLIVNEDSVVYIGVKWQVIIIITIIIVAVDDGDAIVFVVEAVVACISCSNTIKILVELLFVKLKLLFNIFLR